MVFRTNNYYFPVQNQNGFVIETKRVYSVVPAEYMYITMILCNLLCWVSN